MIFASVSFNPKAVFRQTVKDFECNVKIYDLKVYCFCSFGRGRTLLAAIRWLRRRSSTERFLFFYVVSSQFEILHYYHSDVFGNDGKQTCFSFFQLLSMQADSQVELHHSVLTMALTFDVSLNSIFEIFPRYVCQEAVNFLVSRFS